MSAGVDVGRWQRCTLLAGIAFACAGAPEQDRATQPAVRDSAGIAVVEYRELEQPSDGCVVVSRVPRLVLSSGNAGQAAEFYNVKGGRVLANGEVVILNGGTHELLFFSAEGRFMRSVGRQGAGPGEFYELDWIGLGDGDILVWDFRLERLSRFDATGVFIESATIHRGGPIRTPFQIRGRFGDGSFLTIPIEAQFFGGKVRVLRPPRSYERYHPATDRWSHLTDGPGEETVWDGRRVYSMPFARDERFAVAGQYLVLADNAVPSLRFYDLMGNLKRIVRWIDERGPVTEADKRRFAEWSRGSSAYPQESRPTFRFGEQRPVLGRIRSDNVGLIWAPQYTPPWDPPTEWLLFGTDGRFACRATVPPLNSIMDIGSDHLLGVRRDSLGMESIHLYDLMRSRSVP